MSLLSIQNLSVSFGASTVVSDLSYSIAAGEKFALVGESGSGKTVSALATMGLLADARMSGRIQFEGRDLLSLSEPQWRAIRGKDIAMIFKNR
jgi:microcin C transport system ATP-binding protein